MAGIWNHAVGSSGGHLTSLLDVAQSVIVLVQLGTWPGSFCSLDLSLPPSSLPGRPVSTLILSGFPFFLNSDVKSPRLSVAGPFCFWEPRRAARVHVLGN